MHNPIVIAASVIGLLTRTCGQGSPALAPWLAAAQASACGVFSQFPGARDRT